ncbi:MAG: ribose-phosphate pyrophosphokinase, partial [Arcobacter sp.]|nr:ribose-phosphate pyrophosphokinase [Arcobacter sp.]
TKAADALKAKGATSVMACCTHGVLSGPAFERIENSSLDELVVTDTIPQKSHGKITVLSASEITAKAISRIYTNESIQSIFI